MTSQDRPIIVGVAGGTGSGKTTAAQAIIHHLPAVDAAMIQHDWYYRDLSHMSLEERARFNFDEPDALDNDLLIADLERLRAGLPIACPQYDFKRHLRTDETLLISPRRIIVVEGILLFAIPALRDAFDLRLYIDTDDDIRLMRRIKRDIIERGRDIESIQRQYYETVRPMHKAHVAPTRACAHLIIPEGGNNEQAVDVIAGRLKYFLLDL